MIVRISNRLLCFSFRNNASFVSFYFVSSLHTTTCTKSGKTTNMNKNRNTVSTIAVAQMTSSSNQEANYQAVDAMMKESKEHGAVMLFLPECFHFMGDDQLSTIDIAQPFETNDYLPKYQSLAKQYNLWLSLGGYPLQSNIPMVQDNVSSSSLISTVSSSSSTKNKVYNSHIIITNEGIIKGIYSKIHLFDLNKTKQQSNLPMLSESSFTVPGDTLVRVTNTPIGDGSIGLSICYDLRFPLLYNSLVFTPSSTAFSSTSSYPHQCSILTVPAAFTVPTGKAHWEILLRTRAIENQCYVIAAAQVDQHNRKPGRISWGHSMIIDPWGAILAEGKGPENVITNEGQALTNENFTPYTLLYADIDEKVLQKVRSTIPLSEHLRPSIYNQPIVEK